MWLFLGSDECVGSSAVCSYLHSVPAQTSALLSDNGLVLGLSPGHREAARQGWERLATTGGIAARMATFRKNIPCCSGAEGGKEEKMTHPITHSQTRVNIDAHKDTHTHFINMPSTVEWSL
jgi:hypothetical protein